MACPTCAPAYCAPLRCYCGHADCDAAATFVSHTTVSTRVVYDDEAVAPAPVAAEPSDWDEREGPTWIDSM
jgi:hypothetical protein